MGNLPHHISRNSYAVNSSFDHEISLNVKSILPSLMLDDKIILSVEDLDTKLPAQHLCITANPVLLYDLFGRSLTTFLTEGHIVLCDKTCVHVCVL